MSLLSTFSCNETNSEKSLAEKRIIQEIEASSMGMIKDLNIEKVEKMNDSIYVGIHSFTNPMLEKEVRITRNYNFTKGFDTIKNFEDIKFEIKSEGEWVETGTGL